MNPRVDPSTVGVTTTVLVPPASEPAAPAATWQQRAEQAEQRVTQLEAALTSRAAIDQAKGVISAVFGLDVDDAFDVLVWVSQHANVKLATIASRFLDAARDIDLDAHAREELTGLLAELSGTTAVNSGRYVPG